MERLTEKHYLGTDHYMKCSVDCNVDMDCIDCPAFDHLVERLADYEDTGLMPGEIKSMQEEHFSGLEMAKLHSALMELKKYQEADKDGRLVVLPCKVGDTVIDQTFAENPTLMKNIRLEIAYESRCGIVFHMGYSIFADLVEHGRIRPVSEEAEKALGAMKDE